jgi:hypothetical protein
MTPHSTTYYHTSATYFENGAVKKLTLLPATTNYFTYTLDGKGRPYSAIQGTSTALTNSVTYNAFDEPLVVALGLGDSDTYAYDSNTGRMSSYTFSR